MVLTPFNRMLTSPAMAGLGPVISTPKKTIMSAKENTGRSPSRPPATEAKAKRGPMIGFYDEEMHEALQKIAASLGYDATTVAKRAIRLGLPAAVDELMAERAAALAQVAREHGTKAHRRPK